MYDYTYNYGVESNVTTAGQSDLLAALAGAMAVIGILLMIFSIILLISTWKIYTKAGQKGWKSLIPVYNKLILLEITKLPLWYIILFFIPIANIYVAFVVDIELAHKFGKSTGFGVASVFLPIICYPILAFGKAQYQGDEIIDSSNYKDNQNQNSNSNVVPEPQPTAPSVDMGTPVVTPNVVSEPQPTAPSVDMGTPVVTPNVVSEPQPTAPSVDMGTPVVTPNVVPEPQPTAPSVDMETPVVTPNVVPEPQPTAPSVDMGTPVVTPNVVPEPQPTVASDIFNQAPKIEDKTCPQCGSQVNVNSTDCSICGYHF